MSAEEKHKAAESSSSFVGSNTSDWTCTQREREREGERGGGGATWKAAESHPSSSVWTCTDLSIPWAQCLCVWSRQLRAALQDGSPDESFGPGSSAGKEPGPQSEGSERSSNPRVSGDRRHSAYQGLIKPSWVICTVRPLGIGIKTEEVSGRVRWRGGWGRGGREGGGSVKQCVGGGGGGGLGGKRIKGISFRLDELHCHQARRFFESLISFSPLFSKHRDGTRANCWDEI